MLPLGKCITSKNFPHLHFEKQKSQHCSVMIFLPLLKCGKITQPLQKGQLLIHIFFTCNLQVDKKFNVIIFTISAFLFSKFLILNFLLGFIIVKPLHRANIDRLNHLQVCTPSC